MILFLQAPNAGTFAKKLWEKFEVDLELFPEFLAKVPAFKTDS
jgi:hypothetical protein